MTLLSNQRRSRRFSTGVGAGVSSELTHELEADATVERIDIRFYRGPRLDLELRPFGEADGNRFDLLDLTGRDVVVGDDDRFSFEISESLREGDIIGVEYTNQDGDNAYDFVVDMELERAGGVDRIMEVL